MRALVTRPEQDAGGIAAALRARGIEPVIEPMLSVAAEGADTIALDGVQAIVFTSANGVREFARREKRRDLKVYAVGDASARAARTAGFADVKSAGRDAEALAKLVAEELKPADGALLHPRGRDTTGHLDTALRNAGFELRDPVVYRADAAAKLSDAAKEALSGGALDLALFFSPRTARSFAAAVQDAGLTADARKLTAVCLSQAVADALAPLSFAKVIVAAAPNQDALLAALPAPKSSRRIWIYAAAAVVVVIAAVGVAWVATRPGPTAVDVQLSARAPAPQEDPRIAILEREINALKAQVDAAPARLSDVAAAQDERIQSLQDQSAALDKRIAALEERARTGTMTGAELLIATAVLRDAVARGVAYAAPLDAVATLAKDDAEIQAAVTALRPGAAAGVPAVPVLASRFAPVADAIANAAIAPAGSDWIERLWARVARLVTVRRTGAGAAGESAGAIAARAEAKANAGDLAGAVAELDKLTGAPADAAQSWLAQAKARLAADAALDRLSALALQRLSKAE